MITAKQYYSRYYADQYEEINEELDIDSITAKYFKGTKTLKYISEKRNGAIMRDFSIEKSFESFCTDSSMRSDYDQKAAEAKKFDRENNKNKATNIAKEQILSLLT